MAAPRPPKAKPAATPPAAAVPEAAPAAAAPQDNPAAERAAAPDAPGPEGSAPPAPGEQVEAAHDRAVEIAKTVGEADDLVVVEILSPVKFAGRIRQPGGDPLAMPAAVAAPLLALGRVKAVTV